jgi:uncharacterized tellurite resistance protein B-like protein
LQKLPPRLGTAAQKGKLFKELTGTLTGKERKDIVRYHCKLILSDMKLGENEVTTLKQIGKIMEIPESVVKTIVNDEMNH